MRKFPHPERQLVSKFKQPNGVWYLRYNKWIGLGRRSTETRDRNVAERIRYDEEHRYRGLRFGHAPEKSFTPIHYSEFALKFLSFKAGQGSASNTVESYRHCLNNFGKFLKRDEMLHAITLDTIEAYAAYRRSFRRTLKRKNEAGEQINKSIAPKTIRNEMITLATAFKWAERQKFVQSNPAHELELPKKVKYPPRYLTKQDYLKLRNVIDDEEFADVVDFYLLTGIRRGEGPTLRASLHVDLEQGILKLPQAKQKDYKVMPISEHLLPVIKRLTLRAAPGDQFIRYTEDNLTGKFGHYATKAGLASGITFHALRHTFATWLANVGVRSRLLQEMLGQQDPESTKIYTHAYDDDVKRAYDLIELPKN